MIAVLSDIHANLEALEAVLADVADRRVDAVYCLGDTLGYGPDPVPCLDRVTRFDLVLLGNFDLAVLNEPDGYPEGLLRVIRDHRRSVEADDGRRLAYLSALAHRYETADTLYVHGSPHNPLNEYLFPEDSYNSRKMDRVAAAMGAVCFCGHTHVPGVFVPQWRGWEFRSPAECGNEWRSAGPKTIINVGSVGQPRDGDPRAGYVLWDGQVARFVRVEYDVATTIRKVRQSPDIDDMHGDRLGEGR